MQIQDSKKSADRQSNKALVRHFTVMWYSSTLSQPHQEVAAAGPSCFLLFFHSTWNIWKPGSRRGHCQSRMILCLATSHDHSFSHKSQNLDRTALTLTWPLACLIDDLSQGNKEQKAFVKVKPASPSAVRESQATGPPSNHIFLTLITSNKTKQKPPRGLPFPKTAVQSRRMRDKNNISVCYVLNANTRAKLAATIKWW